MSSRLHHEFVGYNGADQDLPTSQPNMQLGIPCKVVTGRGHQSALYPDSSAIPGVPIDAPLTVKQHFQQQRKQQKSRARESKRDARKQTLVNSALTAFSHSIQAPGTSKSEKVNRTAADQQILHPARALSEPAFLNHPQSHQARPSTSKSADQEILRNTNMKIDPRLLGCFSAEDYGTYGTATSKESACSPTKMSVDIGVESALESSLRCTLDSSLQSYDPQFRQSALRTEQKSDDILVRNEGVRGDFIQYPVYSSAGGLEMPNVHGDSGMASINGTLEQNHTDADPTSFDQGVEKLDTETDERFLSWLYCENEHAEDDNAEYTRVLEEIEKDECYTHKVEDNQGPDFGVPACMPSTSHADNFGKAELDFSHSLTSDCIAGDYSSVHPTLQQRDALPDNYTISDFDSDLDLDMMAIREDEETLYGRLLDVLVRDIKLLTYNNAALVDEVSRLNYAIFVASEERKIRRLQTANKRKSDAQRRQQEQMTIAETQENIAQIKAKMAKTMGSPQKMKPTMCGVNSSPTLDVAAIKRSVEAEQRALESKISSRKATRKVKLVRLELRNSNGKGLNVHARKENEDTHSGGSAAKRGRFEIEQREQVGVSPENTPLISESVHHARKSTRGLLSGSEATDEQDRKRRKSSQTSLSRECAGADIAEESDGTTRYATDSVVEDRKMHEGRGDREQYPDFINDENETVRNDQSQSWRRRAGRPPARAASAAAQTLLAAELTAAVDTSACCAKRTNRSRSNTNEAVSYRPPRRRVIPQSLHAHEHQSENSNRMAELNIEVSDEVALEGDMDLDSRYEILDEELTPLGDVAGSEDLSIKIPQSIRSRRSTRTSSRQSIGDAGDGADFSHQGSSSPSHDDAAERSEEPVSMATRSHGRANTSSSSQSERQMRERKQPTMYSPVARSMPPSQLRTVKKKS
uniref:Uncharacterized protein n=1 Tax=Angiostrongylus cantonensis TaxID=6313 RepID=A0A0K0CTZ2_ANGCA